jgi:hypothetical protein
MNERIIRSPGKDTVTVTDQGRVVTVSTGEHLYAVIVDAKVVRSGYYASGNEALHNLRPRHELGEAVYMKIGNQP